MDFLFLFPNFDRLGICESETCCLSKWVKRFMHISFRRFFFITTRFLKMRLNKMLSTAIAHLYISRAMHGHITFRTRIYVHLGNSGWILYFGLLLVILRWNSCLIYYKLSHTITLIGQYIKRNTVMTSEYYLLFTLLNTRKYYLLAPKF